MMNHPYWGEQANRHYDHPFGWLIFFLVLALVVALVVWVVLQAGGGRAGQRQLVAAPADDALDVVRLRYAQGEIDRKEFLRIRGDLGAPPEPSPAPSA